MSKVYTKKLKKKKKSRKQTNVKNLLRTLYFILPTLKTPDVNKQNHWRRKL